MWEQNYLPVADSLFLSAFLAAIPIFVLLTMIGILRKPAWVAAVSGLCTAIIIALAVYGMPIKLALSAVTFGAAQGLFPIGWIVYWAIVMYRVTLDTGKFEVIKDSIGGLTADRRLQAMLMELAPGEPLMSRDNLAAMSVDNVATGQCPGLAALGITPASVHTVAPTYLGTRGGRSNLLKAPAGNAPH